MTPITEIVIPLASMGGIGLLIWGASRFVSASRSTDQTHSDKIKDAKVERKTNAKEIKTLDSHRQDHHTRLVKLEEGRDK